MNRLKMLTDLVSENQPQYIFGIYQIQDQTIGNFINTLDVPEDTFLKDLVLQLMYEHCENPFIDTIMSIPSYIMEGDGLSPEDQVIHTRSVIENWLYANDFSDISLPLKESVREFNKVGLSIEPINAILNIGFMIIEFEVLLTEVG